MQQLVSNSAQLALNGMNNLHIDTADKTLINLKDLLVQLGYSAELDTLKLSLPVVLNKGVQSAVHGVVQDPAGSAIGSGYFPSGSGGSGTIYSHFRDLKPIPKIKPTEAIFNESDHDGGRVLHSYSPHIGHSGYNAQPLQPADYLKALIDLSNSYLNAFMATRLLPPSPGTPEVFTEFGAVPLAGNIFAQNFKNADLNHLHPGITIASILVAQAEMIRAGKTMPKLSLYYFDRPVYKVAASVLSEVSTDLNQ